MPQMAPMNWVFLYMLFSLLLIILTINNYYLFNYKPKSFNNKLFKSPINWKW